MSEGHARLGASGAHRWMVCPGSVRLEADLPDTRSPYADEGTAAHAVAEICLLADEPAASCVGKVIDVEGNPIPVTEEMAEAVQVYLDAIHDTLQPGDVLTIESPFDLEPVTGRNDTWGTADATIYRPSARLLMVWDYKHGAGKVVEVEDNPQEKFYGIGAALKRPEGEVVEEVELVIVQPRADHQDGPVRRWKTDVLELIGFSADIAEAAARTDDPNAPLVPGEGCRFCKAAGICPELRDQALALAQAEFDPVTPVNLPAPASLSPERLSAILRDAWIVKDWIKAVEAFAHSEAQHGRPPAGMKLVPTRATRTWASEDEVVRHLVGLGYDLNDIHTEPKLKSPAQVEKVVSKEDKAGLAALITKLSKNTILVPEEDPREPVKSDAEADFTPVGKET